ncbi:hypothetical protein [Aeromonas veronii]|uniref:hypothetical protein n=1 Tax=Aeromonas veronii TaxID=654 RepID=UPI002B4778CE|nr:hypothetical protein [Aeromonas veronii]
MTTDLRDQTNGGHGFTSEVFANYGITYANSSTKRAVALSSDQQLEPLREGLHIKGRTVQDFHAIRTPDRNL